MGWTFYNSSGQRLQTFGFAAATQAEMEAATSVTAYVSPGRTQYHPGVAKVWCLYEEAGAHSIRVSYNMTSVTDGGATGDCDVLWATDFSGTYYSLVGGCEEQGYVQMSPGTNAAGGCTLITTDNANNAVDYSNPGPSFAVYGDQ